ncbi:MAG: tetratricopeptide repeat protein [Nitrospirae bacterium]|nr:tetratricopeptide repeat protein [Nitrospirota bacterium]
MIDDPLTSEEHINLGVIYEKKGQYDEAISEYKKASETLPVAYFYMGNASFLKGDFKGAEGFYRKAIREDPANADAMNNLAWLYYKLGENLDEAEALVKRAIEIRPERTDMYRDTLMKIEEER